ncbi:MAG: saccharopine dehydrogenase family protein [Cytophagales bacterium]|nr:saccharopine dehydrogenase family protein [Cytophagales bacterium]
MVNILILGAGRSSYHLITHLTGIAHILNIRITVCDRDKKLAEDKIQNRPAAQAVSWNIDEIFQNIKNYHLVISMLPPDMHEVIAQRCIAEKKHFFTASYMTEGIQKLNNEVKQAGLLFLMECGLDPGLDHMTIKHAVDEIYSLGGEVIELYSYCGGLVAKDSDTNPWHYKISWNPRNVVLAGQGGDAQYLQDGNIVSVPYAQLFGTDYIKKITVGNETFEGYANRDSTMYKDIYYLPHIKTLIRGTLRYDGFCKGWHYLINNGYTDNHVLHNTNTMTYKQLFNIDTDTLTSDPMLLAQIQALGLPDDVPINMNLVTYAQVLQHLIEKKWRMMPHDKDRVVMIHKLVYNMDNKSYSKIMMLDIEGIDSVNTAMSKTVGLPLAIVVQKFLEGSIADEGVNIPVHEKYYKAVLPELEREGLIFKYM